MGRYRFLVRQTDSQDKIIDKKTYKGMGIRSNKSAIKEYIEEKKPKRKVVFLEVHKADLKKGSMTKHRYRIKLDTRGKITEIYNYTREKYYR
jgi:hypothetical protein